MFHFKGSSGQRVVEAVTVWLLSRDNLSTVREIDIYRSMTKLYLSYLSSWDHYRRPEKTMSIGRPTNRAGRVFRSIMAVQVPWEQSSLRMTKRKGLETYRLPQVHFPNVRQIRSRSPQRRRWINFWIASYYPPFRRYNIHGQENIQIIPHPCHPEHGGRSCTWILLPAYNEAATRIRREASFLTTAHWSFQWRIPAIATGR